MRMSDIRKGMIYASRDGDQRLVLDIGTHVQPRGSRRPYSGVEYVFLEGDGVRSIKYYDFLSSFANNSTHLVPGP